MGLREKIGDIIIAIGLAFLLLTSIIYLSRVLPVELKENYVFEKSYFFISFLIILLGLVIQMPKIKDIKFKHSKEFFEKHFRNYFAQIFATLSTILIMILIITKIPLERYKWWYIIIIAFSSIFLYFGAEYIRYPEKDIHKVGKTMNALSKNNYKYPQLPMGETIFNILEEVCKTPNSLTYTKKELLDKLNKGKKVDPPYYIGDEEFRMLVKEGYLAYWTPNQELKKLPDHQKPIMATPKAFELVEARKSRILTQRNVTIALFFGLLAFAMTCFSILLNLFREVMGAFIGTVIVMIFLSIILSSVIKKINT